MLRGQGPRTLGTKAERYDHCTTRPVKESLTTGNKIYKCLASTILAAILINGTTIHNFHVNKDIQRFYRNEIRLCICRRSKYEVSMLHSNFYKILMMIKN
jgi:hypothetical protein